MTVTHKTHKLPHSVSSQLLFTAVKQILMLNSHKYELSTNETAYNSKILVFFNTLKYWIQSYWMRFKLLKANGMFCTNLLNRLTEFSAKLMSVCNNRCPYTQKKPACSVLRPATLISIQWVPSLSKSFSVVI